MCSQTDHKQLEEKGSSFGDLMEKQREEGLETSSGEERQLRQRIMEKEFILSGKQNGRDFSNRSVGR